MSENCNGQDRSHAIRQAGGVGLALKFLARAVAKSRGMQIGQLIAEMKVASRTWYSHVREQPAPSVYALNIYGRHLCSTEGEREALFEVAGKSSEISFGLDALQAEIDSAGLKRSMLSDPQIFLWFCDLLLDPKIKNIGRSALLGRARSIELALDRRSFRCFDEDDFEQRIFVIYHRIGLLADQLDDLGLHKLAIAKMRPLKQKYALVGGTVADFEAMFVSQFDQVWMPHEDTSGPALRKKFLHAEKLYRSAKESDQIYRRFKFPDQITAAALNECRVALQHVREDAELLGLGSKITDIDHMDEEDGVGPASLAHNSIAFAELEIAKGRYEKADEKLSEVRVALESVGALTSFWKARLDYLDGRVGYYMHAHKKDPEKWSNHFLELSDRFDLLGNDRRAWECYKRAMDACLA